MSCNPCGEQTRLALAERCRWPGARFVGGGSLGELQQPFAAAAASLEALNFGARFAASIDEIAVCVFEKGFAHVGTSDRPQYAAHLEQRGLTIALVVLVGYVVRGVPRCMAYSVETELRHIGCYPR